MVSLCLITVNLLQNLTIYDVFSLSSRIVSDLILTISLVNSKEWASAYWLCFAFPINYIQVYLFVCFCFFFVFLLFFFPQFDFHFHRHYVTANTSSISFTMFKLPRHSQMLHSKLLTLPPRHPPLRDEGTFN